MAEGRWPVKTRIMYIEDKSLGLSGPPELGGSRFRERDSLVSPSSLSGGFAALFVVAGTALPYVGLRLLLARGQYRLVEGVVRDFVPGDAGDHRAESWTLESSAGSFHYSYNPAIIGEGGYDQTAAHGGQVREGKHVRVLDVNGRIARLEISP